MPFAPNRSSGFSLMEVLLALGLAAIIGGAAIIENQRRTEASQARAVGQQIKSVGDSLNSYIAMRFNQIVTLSSVVGAGDSNDPGERICQAAPAEPDIIGYCTIDSNTLRRNGLLPLSFTGRNVYGAEYRYYILVSGMAPNWRVEGMVTTDRPYLTNSVDPRFDLIGEAMLEAGADSSTNRASAVVYEGLNGAWLENRLPGYFDFVPQPGLIGYRAGYGSAGFAAYLRTDGASSMTGHLNMGNNDIFNVSNIEATGTVTAMHVATVPGGSFRLGYDPDDPGDLELSQSVELVSGPGSTLNVRANGGTRFLNNAGTEGSGVEAGSLFASGAVTAGQEVRVRSGGRLLFNEDGDAEDQSGFDMPDGDTVRVVNGKNLYTSGIIRGSGMRVEGTVALNSPCGPEQAGELRRDQNTQNLLECRQADGSRRWQSMTVSTEHVVASDDACGPLATSTALCGIGQRVASGGYSITGFPQSNQRVPHSSLPVGSGGQEGWRITNSQEASEAMCFRAVAVCSM